MQYSSYADMTDEDLRKEIYKLSRHLHQEAKEIKRIHKEDDLVPQLKAREVVKLRTEMRKNPTKYLDRKELISRARRIRYLFNLKTTFVEGAKTGGKRYEPIRRYVEGMTEDEKKDFFDVFKQVYDRQSSYEQFKYNIFDEMKGMHDTLTQQGVIDSESGMDEYKSLGSKIIELRDSLNENYPWLKDEHRDEVFNEVIPSLFNENLDKIINATVKRIRKEHKDDYK